MNGRPWLLAGLLGMGLPLAGLVLGEAAPWWSVGASLLGGGAALTLLFIPEMSLLLWLGTSAVFGVGILLLHGLLQRFVVIVAHVAFLPSLAGMSCLLGLGATVILWRVRWPRVIRGVTRGDLVLLIGVVPVLASTLLVSAANGYLPGPDGRPHAAEASRDREEFHARGFVNGDTFTLFALTNSFGNREPGVGSRARYGNPFAAGAPLEYPTLLHRALAGLMTATGSDITRTAWWLILPSLAGTVAVSVLSAQAFLRGHHLPVWAGIVLLLAYGATWESFTYPQSHTFLTGLLLLFMLLLVRRDQSDARGERVALRYAIGVLAIILLFSNAVLGTAAVAIAVAANLLQAPNRRWPLYERISGLVGTGILLTLFRLFPPGAGELGTLNFAYTAVPQFLTAALPALVVLWGLWEINRLQRLGSLLVAAVVLAALALVTLLLSRRDIVAENSPRFLYLLVLLGWPVVVPVVQRVADWWWRQARHFEQTLAQQAALFGGGAFVLVVLLLPVLASVTGTLDVLVRKPPQVVSADELAAFAWIRDQTPPAAVFLRAPESQFDDPRVAPLALPAFTGRAQLRSEYWLSPEDEVLKDVRAFFSGNGGAPAGASYLFCGPEIIGCPTVGTPVFSSGSVTVREL